MTVSSIETFCPIQSVAIAIDYEDRTRVYELPVKQRYTLERFSPKTLNEAIKKIFFIPGFEVVSTTIFPELDKIDPSTRYHPRRKPITKFHQQAYVFIKETPASRLTKQGQEELVKEFFKLLYAKTNSWQDEFEPVHPRQSISTVKFLEVDYARRRF